MMTLLPGLPPAAGEAGESCRERVDSGSTAPKKKGRKEGDETAPADVLMAEVAAEAEAEDEAVLRASSGSRPDDGKKKAVVQRTTTSEKMGTWSPHLST